jgi:carboxypeptidase T
MQAKRAVVVLMLAFGAAVAQPADRQIVRIRFSAPEQVRALEDLNLDFVSEALTRERDAVVSDDELATIRARGFPTTIVKAKDGRFSIPAEYHDYLETFRVFDSLQTRYPDILHIDTIGYSLWQHDPIWGIRISDHPDQDEDESAILFTGVTHAREPMGDEILIHLAKYLCSNYASSPAVRRWVDSLEILMIPIVNVDGFQFMFDSATVDPWWRKNQRDNDHNGRFNRDYDGVDLNRNFDWRWTWSGSTNPPDVDYRGPSAGSEPEVQTWCRFALRHRPVFGISYHSYGNVVIYSWRWGNNDSTPDEDIFVATGQVMAQLTGYALRPTGGCNGSAPWTYGRVGVLDYMIETSASEFIPRAESIPTICAINFKADTFLLSRMLYGGVWGHVRDAVSDSPLVAEIQVVGRTDTALVARVSDSTFGRFHRALLPGSYDLVFTAPGYETLFATGIPTSNDSLTRLEVRLRRRTAIIEQPATARRMTLDIRPNPFIGSTALPGHERERLLVLDPLGRRVAECFGDRIGAALSPGVYFVRPVTGDGSATRIVKLR